jgi:hypothetical protein
VSHTVIFVSSDDELVNPDVKSRVFDAVGDDKPKILSADIVMISGCDDHQTSADVSNVA